jgi:hypothetical protein
MCEELLVYRFELIKGNGSHHLLYLRIPILGFCHCTNVSSYLEWLYLCHNQVHVKQEMVHVIEGTLEQEPNHIVMDSCTRLQSLFSSLQRGIIQIKPSVKMCSVLRIMFARNRSG